MTQHWTHHPGRDIVHDQWLHLHAARLERPDGVILDPFYLIREHSWACCIPVCPDGRILMVEQYRPGIERVTLEFPCGDIDPGEDPVTAAARELTEETGLEAIGPLTPLGHLQVEPARNNAIGHGFLCRVAGSPSQASPEAAAGIGLRTCSVAELQQERRAGAFAHAVHVAFFWQVLAEQLLDL